MNKKFFCPDGEIGRHAGLSLLFYVFNA